jgi:hypothetical protein
VNRRKKNVLSLIPLLTCPAFAIEGNADSLALQSTPTFRVLVYSFQGLPSWVLAGAEVEAARILQPTGIGLKWIDSNSGPAPTGCGSLQPPTDLVIRFVPHAVPPASATALAMALRSPDPGVAFIFYDRVTALQTSTSLLQTMLGRVVAHEITHLLLPEEEHSHSGLMRADWKQDDLRFTSTASGNFSTRLIDLLKKEARRRALRSDRVRASLR